MPRRGPRLLIALLACAIGAAANATSPPQVVTVERIVDGDTMDVRDAGRTRRVRLIGIDTPELHSSAKLDAQLRRGWDAAVIRRLGRLARDETRRLIGDGPVRLELDTQTHDRYGRLLAYVWRGEVLVNAELLRGGYAVRLTIPPNVRYAERFAASEADAREARRGLWASWPPIAAPPGAR